MNNKTIGIIDSGIGGISVYRETVKTLDGYEYIYLADKVNFPYGEKSSDEIKNILSKNIEWMRTNGVELVVLACNTATVNGIQFLRNKYKDMKFVGLEPAVKPAAKIAKKGILVLSTEGTTKSKQLDQLIKAYANDINVIKVGSQELVRAVEERWGDEKLEKAFKNIFDKSSMDKIDVVVLGCTHFPLVKKQMQEFLGDEIRIVDSSEAVARQVKKVIEENNLINQSNTSSGFYSSAEEFEFDEINFEPIHISRP